MEDINTSDLFYREINNNIDTSDLFRPEINNVSSNITLLDLDSYRPSDSLHLKEDLFAKYFDIIILENSMRMQSDSKVCPLKSIYITDYFITLDFVNFTYKIPQFLKNSIDSCNIINSRFYIIPLRINFNYKSAHSNLMIIDNKLFTKKQLFFFNIKIF